MITDLAELSKFLKLCRKQGVKDIKFGDCTVSFGDLPRKLDGDADEQEPETPDDLTPEQLMFFSAGGQPP